MKLDWWKPIKTGGEYTCESCRRTTDPDYGMLNKQIMELLNEREQLLEQVDTVQDLLVERNELLDMLDSMAVKHVVMKNEINQLQEDNKMLLSRVNKAEQDDKSGYHPFVANTGDRQILVSIFTDDDGTVDSVNLAFRENTWETWSVPVDAERG